MRLPQGAAVLALWLAAAPAFAAEPAAPTATQDGLSEESLTLARQIWEIALPPEQRLAIFGGMMKAVADQMAPSQLSEISDPEIRKIIANKVATVPDRLMPVTEKHIPAMMESYARADAREFSEDELRHILAFARSPAGKRYLIRSTAALEDPDVAAANRAYFADAKIVQDELAQEIVSIFVDRMSETDELPKNE